MVVDGKPHIRPCVSIPPDGNEGNDWIASIGDLYAPLTTPLPLAGASALARVRGGNEPRAVAALRSEAPWMAAAINRIAEQIAMQAWAGRPWLAVRPMLLVGPPGAGKTRMACHLGALSGCGDAVLSLAGVGSNAELAGSPRGFRHPQPCFPAMAMLKTGTANPVVVIDEVDKAASGDTGDPLGTLVGLLERSTARRYFDGCLAAEIDLSHVSWILTANRIDRLPAPLLSRVEVVEVTGPTPEDGDLVLASLWQAVAGISACHPRPFRARKRRPKWRCCPCSATPAPSAGCAARSRRWWRCPRDTCPARSTEPFGEDDDEHRGKRKKCSGPQAVTRME